MQGARVRDRVFRTRFRTSNHARNAHDRSGASLGEMKNCDLEILVSFGIRDFEESEIPRILRFLAVPMLCRDNVMQARKRGARRACV